MKEKLFLNISLLKKHYAAAFSVLTGGISAVLLFIGKDELGIDSLNLEISVSALLLFIPFLYAFLRILFYRKNVKREGKLVLRYGDLWKIAFSKHSESKKIVVVGVNTSYDTIVDKELASVEKALVSEKTIHGQWIEQMLKHNVSLSEIDKMISDSLKLQGIQPCRMLKREQKRRGKLECYPKGTIAVCEYQNTFFYLLALSEFDENNNTQNSKEEFIHTILRLIKYYDGHGQKYDIYIPLLGSGQSRTDIEEDESLRILTSMFDFFRDKIHGCVNIIVYDKDKKKVSLDI